MAAKRKITSKRKVKTLRESAAKGSAKLKSAASAKTDPVEDRADIIFEAPEISRDLWSKPPAFLRKGPGGHPKITESPEEIWEQALEYFGWVHDNPLMELKAMSSKDDGIQKVALPKMRAMTIEGLCIWLGISRDTWNKWGRNYNGAHPEKTDVCAYINQIIREQKFTAAAADLMNANFISKDLGLLDRIEHNGNPDAPMTISVADIISDRLAKLRPETPSEAQE